MNPYLRPRSKSTTPSNSDFKKTPNTALTAQKKIKSKQVKSLQHHQMKLKEQHKIVSSPNYTTTQVPVQSIYHPQHVNPNIRRTASIDARLTRLSLMFPEIDNSIILDIIVARNGDINLCVSDLLELNTEHNSSPTSSPCEEVPAYQEEQPPLVNLIASSDSLEFPPDYNDLQLNTNVNLYGGSTDINDVSLPADMASGTVMPTPIVAKPRTHRKMLERANTVDALPFAINISGSTNLIDIDPLSIDLLLNDPNTYQSKKIQSNYQKKASSTIPVIDTSYLMQWKRDQTCWLQVNNHTILIGPLPDDFLRLSSHRVNSEDTSSSFIIQPSAANSSNTSSGNSYKPPPLFPLDTREAYAFSPQTNSTSNNKKDGEVSPYMLPKRLENIQEYYQDEELIDAQITDDLKLSHFLQNQEFMEQVQLRQDLYNNLSKAAGIQLELPNDTVLKPEDASYMHKVDANLKEEFYSKETLQRIDKKTKKKLTKLAKKFNAKIEEDKGDKFDFAT